MMTQASATKISSNGMAVPRSISFIVVSIGTLAFFLFIASQLLVSHPIGSTLQGYLLGVDRPRVSPSLVSLRSNESKSLIQYKGASLDDEQERLERTSLDDEQERLEGASPGGEQERLEVPSDQDSVLMLSTNGTRQGGDVSSSVSQNSTEVMEVNGDVFGNASSRNYSDGGAPAETTLSVEPLPATQPDSSRKVDSGSCDLYHGRWIYDPAGALYTNNTCPIITQMQNCQGNGRPDKDYENWRWKPDQCDLPRFDGRKFLELMRGKTLAFIGDSVGRNQMESLLCILWQVEVPRNRGSRRMQKWYFRSTSTNIVRVWSSWLVHKTNEPFKSVPDAVIKVHLDLPDEDFMEFLPRFDVVVLSSGHWFAKQSAYILNGKIVGGQLWWPKGAGPMQVNNIEAFGISVETSLASIAMHPNFTGLAIVRSYSPDHYEGGAWNTGGSCTGKAKPASEVVRNGFTDVMHEKQVMGFQRAVKKAKSGAKLRLMDITEPFGFRQDGHPGPYRSPDPNKVTKRGPDGKPPPQDCLHWCMPGPIDTWNEMLLEIIRRDFEGA